MFMMISLNQIQYYRLCVCVCVCVCVCGCMGLSFLHEGFLLLQRAGACSLVAVSGLLIVVASFVAEHRLQGAGFSSSGTQAQLPHCVWDLPGPGIEPVFPALAGRFLTTGPPGKPTTGFVLNFINLTALFPFSDAKNSGSQ